MLSICGADCCTECGRKDECGGCVKTGGHPFGGKCFAAECIKRGGFEEFKSIKKALTEEFNALGIKDLEVKDLNLLNGFYVNLEYPLPNGQSVKFLEDNNVYWGNQIEIPGSGSAVDQSDISCGSALFAQTAPDTFFLTDFQLVGIVFCPAVKVKPLPRKAGGTVKDS